MTPFPVGDFKINGRRPNAYVIRRHDKTLQITKMYPVTDLLTSLRVACPYNKFRPPFLHHYTYDIHRH